MVCHGDLSIPNVLFDPVTVEFAGLIDVGRVGVADRHADLGIVTRSLGSDRNSQYHPDGARRFLDRYTYLVPDAGIDPAKLAYYRLLDEFFSPAASPGADAAAGPAAGSGTRQVRSRPGAAALASGAGRSDDW